MTGSTSAVGRYLTRQARRLRALRIWRAWGGRTPEDPAALAPDEPFPFRCNLCGAANAASLGELTREDPTCTRCASNVRFRAVAYLVTREVLGRPAAFVDFPARREIKGLGLSDAYAYARGLARRFDYENTWYHKAPRLDITKVDPACYGRYDFLVASDVFEHVAPPVEHAFRNARRLLAAEGKFVFTVPFSLDAQTHEHYPELHDWSLARRDERWMLVNRTADGREQTFTDLVFHGGPGSTLELRLFSRAALEREFLRAGFARVRVADEPWLPFGIHWPHPWSVPMVAYAS